MVSLARRVWITACTGTGKSTLAAQLAHIGQCRHIELDALHWEADWTPAATAVFRQRVAAAIDEPAWIVDGNYTVVSDVYLPRVEMVIWLDYSFTRILLRLLRRTFKRAMWREVLWQHNQESLLRVLGPDSIVLWLCKTYWKRKREVPARIEALRARGVRIVHFRHPQETEQWVAALKLNQDLYPPSIPTTGDCR
ncbi:MAG: toxin [Burkholderiales bacterium]|nr:toxin [Burkholderiales bacterium]